ncbi:MAG: hypothetical protein M1814_003629 [Vezdaea aestivalis]|nr:MAG: hypothetical protein M1814_003629 [Vezdaea aestivalis]
MAGSMAMSDQPSPDESAIGAISFEDVENAVKAICKSSVEGDKDKALEPLAETELLRIAKLLELSGRDDWSLRPRTFTLLILVKRSEVLQSFIEEGLSDLSIPFSEQTLPYALKGDAARSKFLELQPLVFSAQASDVEKADGRHRHFSKDGDIHFQRIKWLGRGGFGDVDHVWSRLSLEEYARKRIHRGRTFQRDKEAIKDFENELATLKRLAHKHLIKFVGSYSDPQYIAILMSPVADCDLSKFLKADPFPAERLQLLHQSYGCLTSALLHLHDNKIRHKDIKPGNILIHGDNVLLTDFGTSYDWSMKDESMTASMPNAICVPYCAPEVMMWEPRNLSSDIYSLGCVFLEISTVISGETLEAMRSFFESNGTQKEYVRTNKDAMELWVSKLSQLARSADRNPAQWAKDMLDFDTNKRPTARQLFDLILVQDSIFCGTCCLSIDDSDKSSYQGSLDISTAPMAELNTTQQEAVPVERNNSGKERILGDQSDSSTSVKSLERNAEQNAQEAMILSSCASQSLSNLQGTWSIAKIREMMRSGPLLFAIETIEFSLNRKALRLETLGSAGEFYLCLAASIGRSRIVEGLLLKGLNPTSRGTFGFNAIEAASLYGQRQVLDTFRRCGFMASKINTLVSGSSRAKVSGQKLERFFSEYTYVSINALRTQPESRMRHFEQAIVAQDTDRLWFLLGIGLGETSGLDKPSGLDELFFLAVQKEKSDSVRILLDAGVDWFTLRHGTPALSYAIFSKSIKVTTALLEYGVPPGYFSAPANNPLHLSLQGLIHPFDLQIDMMKLLMDHGARGSAQNLEGHNVLQEAVRRLPAGQCFKLVVSLLLSYEGRLLEARNNRDETVLLEATSRRESVAKIKCLLNAGAIATVKDRDGWTPLHHAVRQEDKELVTLLLNHGADPLQRNKVGKTPRDYTPLAMLKPKQPFRAKFVNDPIDKLLLAAEKKS